MPSQNTKKKHSISTQAAFLLIALALLFDGVQAGIDLMHAIPVVGNVAAVTFTVFLDVWAYLSIWFGFKVAAPDISFMRPKRALALNGAFLIELIPIINILPAWTLSVVIIIVTSRGEEAIEKTLEKTGKMMGAAGKLAGAASKLAPNPAMRASLAKVSKGATQASQFAQSKAASVRSARESGGVNSGGPARLPTSAGVETARNIAPAQRATTPGVSSEESKPPPPPNTSKQDIGAPPIFHQASQNPTVGQNREQPKPARKGPYAEGEAYIAGGTAHVKEGTSYIRKGLGKR